MDFKLGEVRPSASILIRSLNERSDNLTENEKEQNSIQDIRKFLSTPENPVSIADFTEFWKSLTDEEKEEYKNTPLPKSE